MNCLKGICIDQLNQFKCLCRDGLTGPTCLISTNPCESNSTLCGSYGKCFPKNTNSSKSSDYFCKCKIGFKGNNCQTPLSQCDMYSPCLNGATCVDISEKEFKCKCSLNYTGSYCEKHINPCIENPSLCNMGTCVNSNKSDPKNFTCVCPTSHSGELCQNIVRPCEPNPCTVNQGFCQQTVLKEGSLSFKCICVNGDLKITLTILKSINFIKLI